MEAIFIIGATISFSMAFLVFTKKEKSLADYILRSWLAILGVYFIVLYSRLFIKGNVLLFEAGFSIPLLLGPVLFLYVVVIVNGENKFRSVYWLHGLPYLLFNLYFIMKFFPFGFTENWILLNLNDESVHLFRVYFYLSSNPVYIILALFKLRRHKKNISNNFSYTENIDLIWLNYVVIFYGILWIMILVIHLLTEFPVEAYTKQGYLIYTLLTIFLFVLGFFGLKQQTIYKGEPIVGKTFKDADSTGPDREKRYKRSGLKKAESKEYLKQLQEYFENEKPYYNEKLNLKDVAEYLNISANYVSQVINEQLNISFFEFVNKYRIREAKSRLCDPENENLTLMAIAFDSGFNSKSCFNRVFKKVTGFTPSQYIKREKIIQ
ncbi:MAG: AraC family transcriptional regulator [Acidobacteriota bacterium]